MQVEGQGETGGGETATEAAARELIRDFSEIDYIGIGVAVLTTWAIIYAVQKTFPWIAKLGPAKWRLYVLALVPVIRLFTIVILLAVIVQSIFILNRENIFFLAGGLGVAVGFAFRDLLASVIAGVVAVFERPYRPGDWVRLDGNYGEVMAIGLRAFTMRTPDDDIITVPHDRIWENSVGNSNDGASTLMCVAEFYLAPDHDPHPIRAALANIALTSPFVNYDHDVVVIVMAEPAGTLYRLKAYPFDMRDQFAFITDMTVRGKAAIRDAGGREIALPVSAGA